MLHNCASMELYILIRKIVLLELVELFAEPIDLSLKDRDTTENEIGFFFVGGRTGFIYIKQVHGEPQK